MIESAPRKALNHREWARFFNTWDVAFAYEALIKSQTAMRSLSLLDFLNEYQDKKYHELLDASGHFYKTLIDPLSHFPESSQIKINDFLKLWNTAKENLNQKTNDFTLSLGGTYWLARTPAEKRKFEDITRRWYANEY